MSDFPTGGPMGVTQFAPDVLAAVAAVKDRLAAAHTEVARITGILALRQQTQDLTRQLLLIELLQNRDASMFSIVSLNSFMSDHKTLADQQTAVVDWTRDLNNWQQNAPPNVNAEPDTYSAKFPEKPAVLSGLVG